ncbi:hypothetical protein IWQ60_004207 [Tieghemiomyces parasiticus]|uniref:AB hydrolase-1 domain-containing protein n=1 Tax=Tieghemiomyces parasiticus TaxID=78921 RepID=A0A9W8ABV5_9FUNG|nr:hypothetical protein IWQ60_004207 [Tieghemiomyces parasiticus]
MTTADPATTTGGSAIAQPPIPFRHYLTTLPGRWPSTEFKAHYAEHQLLSNISFFCPDEPLESPTAPISRDGSNVCGGKATGLVSHVWNRLSPFSGGHTAVNKNTQCRASTTSSNASAVSATSSPSQTPVSPSGWVARVGNIDIGNGLFLRTVALEREDGIYTTTTDGQEAAPLVMGHGFGTGIGIFFRNYESLAIRSGRRVYGIDWLGMGLSARPNDLPWLKAARTHPDDPATIHQTEAFFIEALDRWRVTMGIEKMVLLGHSFGGYMAALYGLHYPDHVEKLFLVSPLGVAEPPKGFIPWVRQMMEGKATDFFPGFGADRPRATGWVPGTEVELANPNYASLPPQEVQETIAQQAEEYAGVDLPPAEPTAKSDTTDPTTGPSQPAAADGGDERVWKAGTPEHRRQPRLFINNRQLVLKLLAMVWRSHYSPQWIVRRGGPLGSMLVNQYIGRYEYLPLPERNALSDYLYHLASRPGSGEYSLTILTYPFVFPRLPLVPRLTTLRVPTVFMYGVNDWMDYRGAEAASRQMPVPTRIVHIDNAGHNLMVENPEDFNAYVLKELAISGDRVSADHVLDL